MTVKINEERAVARVVHQQVQGMLEKNLEFSKPDLYKKWFGAKEDGSDLVSENCPFSKTT